VSFFRGHINIIADCDISFDERKFATASWDKTVKIWDVATGAYRSLIVSFLNLL
jgi:WD40 repeat protein